MDINQLLASSLNLETRLTKFLSLPLYDSSERIKLSKIMCSIAFEHAESTKILIASGNLTSATGLVRLQYEALVRAMWLRYSASDNAVSKLNSELSNDSARRAANQLPTLTEMLTKLEGKAPAEAMELLIEFKEYSWKPLNSYVHGGIHAMNRHSEGYSLPLLVQVLKASNGVSTMVAMLLVILAGDTQQTGKIPSIQKEFSDCLPDIKVSTE